MTNADAIWRSLLELAQALVPCEPGTGGHYEASECSPEGRWGDPWLYLCYPAPGGGEFVPVCQLTDEEIEAAFAPLPEEG